MKWIFFVALIGLSIFAYNQQRSLSEERLNLEKAQAQVADLEMQIQKIKKQNPFLSPLPGNANSPQDARGPWKGSSTTLDPAAPKRR